MKFDTWCKHKNYRTGTIRVSVRHVAQAARIRAADGELPETILHSLRRYLAFAAAVPADADGELVRWLEERGVAPVSKTPRAKPKRRMHEAVSHNNEDWDALAELVYNHDEPEGYVLRCMMATGVRVGDALRLERDVLAQALGSGVLPLERKGGTFQNVPIGGAVEEWVALFDEMKAADAETVAEYVCPANPSPEAADAAYMRMRRTLHRLSAEAEVQGRHNLHRIRRTKGVQAAKETGNMEVVRQLLGHRTISSTQQYTDELQLDEVAELQRKLGRKKA